MIGIGYVSVNCLRGTFEIRETTKYNASSTVSSFYGRNCRPNPKNISLFSLNAFFNTCICRLGVQPVGHSPIYSLRTYLLRRDLSCCCFLRKASLICARFVLLLTVVSFEKLHYIHKLFEVRFWIAYFLCMYPLILSSWFASRLLLCMHQKLIADQRPEDGHFRS